MPSPTFQQAIPVLPSLDIERSVAFFRDLLGFDVRYAEADEYGIVRLHTVEIHFWACNDPTLPRSSGCRLAVHGVTALYQHCQAGGVVHPNAPLAEKPWGTREFAIVDFDGNLITFFEQLPAM